MSASCAVGVRELMRLDREVERHKSEAGPQPFASSK